MNSEFFRHLHYCNPCATHAKLLYPIVLFMYLSGSMQHNKQR